MTWIKDKAIKPQPNSMVVIAVRVDAESVDYHTAIFNICESDGDNTFVLASDSIGQVFELDEIEAWMQFDRI